MVLNRVRHPAYPRTVCGVVFQGQERATGCQFTFTCDGALRRTPSASGWARARRVAEEALAGKVYAPVGWATHYHTNWVVPYWSSSLVKLANVGTHIFFRWEGGWGKPAAFRFSPARVEPQIAKMRSLTSDPTSLADAPTIDDAAALAAAEAAAVTPRNSSAAAGQHRQLRPGGAPPLRAAQCRGVHRRGAGALDQAALGEHPLGAVRPAREAGGGRRRPSRPRRPRPSRRCRPRPRRRRSASKGCAGC